MSSFVQGHKPGGGSAVKAMSSGYFSEPGYLDPSDRSRKEYKGGVLNERVMGNQILSTTGLSGSGIGESAYMTAPERATLGKKTRDDKNATFSVFERLYAEAYKPQNHHETEYDKSVKKKVIGPAWRPNPATGKSRPTGSGVGFH